MRPPAPVRFGFWGAGSVAGAVGRDLALVTDADLVVVGGRAIERARVLARTLGGATATDRYADVLEDPSVDVVYVSTPAHCHAVDCIRAIEHGKAVLCEKPFTVSAEEARRVVAAARSNGVFVMEAMWMRFVPAVVEAKRLVDGGAIGRVRSFDAEFANVARPPAGGAHASVAAGALYDRGVYALSLAFHLLGPYAVGQACATLDPNGVDEQVACLLTYDDGAIARLSSSTIVHGRNEALVLGDRGRLLLHEPFYGAHRITHRSSDLTDTSDGTPGATEGTSARDRAVAFVRDRPVLRGLSRRVQPLFAARRRGRARSMAYPGGGYQFEIAEVVRCLHTGRLESSTMPLDESVAIVEALESLSTRFR